MEASTPVKDLQKKLRSKAHATYLDLRNTENRLDAWKENQNQAQLHATGIATGSGLITGPQPFGWEPLAPHYHLASPDPPLTMYGQAGVHFDYRQEPAQNDHYRTNTHPEPPSSSQPYHQIDQSSFPSSTIEHDEVNMLTSNNDYLSQNTSPTTTLSPSSSSADLELKRMRNTAASARFRAKKKRREASLERSAREKEAALEQLEKRIRDLEAENSFLKELIFDKEKLKGVKTELEELKEKKKKLQADSSDGEGLSDAG